MTQSQSKRIGRIEASTPPKTGRAHRIIVPVGGTQEQAVADWEADHGPLPDGDFFIARTIVQPETNHASE